MLAKNTFDVSNDIVLITGTSGQLGNEYASAFLMNGAKVIGLDVLSTAKCNSLQLQYPDTYWFCKSDVTNKRMLSKALAQITERFGVPTVLINNAAIDSPPSSPPEENGPFEEYPEDSWDQVIDVNLKGTYLSCQVFGSAMAKAGKGSIINVSSIYGIVSPDQSIYDFRRKRGEVFFKPVAYSASKSGVINLTRYLAAYWAKSGVRVNSLTIAGVFNNQEKDFLTAYCDRIPIGRMANRDEYNGPMLFLASEASSYMTGSNLIIDGGWTAI
ncbi:SDR family oxidoreductase [Thalassospira sp. ER-Se-21-Dark]|uniref:SDR family oxidoreductase n=1 Tax=Thalassospira sp. ER-Se-21-Dark TaxID=2585190 RepID=UPI001B308DD9|nr:SDR family oxidoreductase [Thalassospira sp. ER-Se-21-Dark]MBP3128272.1 SDR family oxidoreductase [Thalassospira sp. ER-Se-21-Dark]